MPAAKTSADLFPIFEEMKELLIKHAKGVTIVTALPNSTAKENKLMISQIGKRDVAVGKRKPQKTYVNGIILQKHFVSFYAMPLSSHPHAIVLTDPDLKKMKKGKSCINLTKLTPSMKKELEWIIKEGVRLYKKEEWI